MFKSKFMKHCNPFFAYCIRKLGGLWVFLATKKAPKKYWKLSKTYLICASYLDSYRRYSSAAAPHVTGSLTLTTTSSLCAVSALGLSGCLLLPPCCCSVFSAMLSLLAATSVLCSACLQLPLCYAQPACSYLCAMLCLLTAQWVCEWACGLWSDITRCVLFWCDFF